MQQHSQHANCEAWECDVFDNLGHVSLGNSVHNHENHCPDCPPAASAASARELASGMRMMPVFDDESWCPRLA